MTVAGPGRSRAGAPRVRPHSVYEESCRFFQFGQLDVEKESGGGATHRTICRPGLFIPVVDIDDTDSGGIANQIQFTMQVQLFQNAGAMVLDGLEADV